MKIYCACGCGELMEELNKWGYKRRYIVGHNNNGKKFTKEHRNKMSKANTGKKHTEDTKKKMSEIRKGRFIGENSPNFGIKRSDGTKQKLRDINTGKQHSETTKKKMSETRKDKNLSEEHCRRISESKKGEKNPMFGKKGEENSLWRGGVSFEPYCPKFNNEFKERVREFFGRKCFECGISELQYMNKQKENKRIPGKLLVHHVNYDKMVCCNNVKPLFVPLCRSCHGKTGANRDYWEDKFTKELIEKYNGECFLQL